MSNKHKKKHQILSPEAYPKTGTFKNIVFWPWEASEGLGESRSFRFTLPGIRLLQKQDFRPADSQSTTS